MVSEFAGGNDPRCIRCRLGRMLSDGDRRHSSGREFGKADSLGNSLANRDEDAGNAGLVENNQNGANQNGQNGSEWGNQNGATQKHFFIRRLLSESVQSFCN